MKELFITTIIITSIFCSFVQAATRNLNLTEEEALYLQGLNQIRYCTGPDSMPLDDIVDDEHLGIGSEYIKLFQNYLPVPLILVTTETWEQSLEYIKNNQCDIIGLAARTSQREEYLLFTRTYVDIPFVLVTTQEKFFISKLAQIVEKKLGVLTGYAYIDLLRDRFPDIELVEVGSRKEGLELVSEGKIFGYLSGLNLAGYAIQTGKYTNLKINGQFDELTTIKLGLGVRKEHAQLKTIFDKIITSIDANEKRRIDNSWLTIRYEIVEDFQRIIYFAILATAILILLFYYQLKLRKHNLKLEESEKKIWKQANYDFLTALPNRRLFQDRLEQQIERVKRYNEKFALLLIDLDRFKDVNDTLGHEQGDMLLKEAAHRISLCIRSSDTIARLGGDEFVVILSDVKREDFVEVVAQKIIDCLQAPFQLNQDAYVTASIGITLCPKDSEDIVELLKNADQAMYSAKSSGRDGFNYFTQSMQLAAMNRANLVRQLRKAVEEEEFEVFYQPVINFETGEYHQAEALLIWNHPERGIVKPELFIDVLEETGLIAVVGNWVFSETCKKTAFCRQSKRTNFQISMNTSRLQFQPDTIELWNDMLRKNGIDSSAIAIEITESTLMEKQDDISNYLIELRDQGYQVLLDDFGKGYSTLSYLKKYDIDFIKIDNSFVNQINKDSDDFILCEAIIVMAHRLGLKVVAEGIENEEQFNLLKEAGCDYGQGYYLSKPLTSIEFNKFLKRKGLFN